MRRTTRTSIALLALVTLAGCGETQVIESPIAETSTSTSVTNAETSTTQPSPTTTTVPVEPSNSTTSVPLSSTKAKCPSDLPLDASVGAPVISLLPPSPPVVPISEADQYYSWRDAIATDSYTLTFLGAHSGDDPSTTVIQMRLDGANQHLLLSEEGRERDELVIVGEDIWARYDDTGWEQIEEVSHSVGMIFAPVSPQLWYEVAHGSLASTEFAGWADLDGTQVAVLSGDSAATQLATSALGISEPIADGSVTLRWDPAGFFRSVSVTFADEFGSWTGCWMVTDIGETRVTPPE